MKGFWATILIIAGALFLGQNFNVISDNDLEKIFSFWPLLLVLFGLWLIVKGFKYAMWLMVAALLAAGAFVYVAGFTDNPLFSRFQPESRRTEDGQLKRDQIKVEMEQDVKSIEAEVNTGAIQFEIEDGTENILEGDLLSSFLDPDLESDIVNGVAKVKLDTVSFRRRIFFQDFRNELNLKLNKNLPTSLKVNTGASDVNFDLSDLIISSFNLNAGGSDINVRFGEKIQNGAKATFEVGASSIKIDVPTGVGVKINSESGLTGENFRGFTQKDGDYYSDGYETTTKKIEIVLRAGASSVEVNRY